MLFLEQWPDNSIMPPSILLTELPWYSFVDYFSFPFCSNPRSLICGFWYAAQGEWHCLLSFLQPWTPFLSCVRVQILGYSCGHCMLFFWPLKLLAYHLSPKFRYFMFVYVTCVNSFHQWWILCLLLGFFYVACANWALFQILYFKLWNFLLII